jgi:hypothetical protein
MVIVLLVVHIITSVLDGFAPIRLIDAVIPFVSQYRPLWLGFGALSFDILIAIVITSLIRRRLGFSAWRAIHWLAYASWPIAVLHGLGTGSDTKLTWALLVTAACVAAVTVATAVRIARARPESERARRWAMAVTLALPLGLAIFTLLGPLAHGWARRAGTPASLLSRPVTVAAITPPARSSTKPAASATTLKPPFTASLSGSVAQSQVPGGQIVDLSLTLRGGAQGTLRVRLAGAPLGGGGLTMTGSQVDLLAQGLPSVMEGQVTSLAGQVIDAHVAGSTGPALNLHVSLNIQGQSGPVTGTLRATGSGGG